MQPLVQCLHVQAPHHLILFVENQVRHCHSHTQKWHFKAMLWCCQVAPLATRSFTACTTGTSWAAPVEFTTWSDMALLAYTMILMFYALSLTSSDGMCHLPKMFWVVFAPLSNRFWNFRPSWTGTVGSRGQKTGGKGDFRLSFWKPLSFWICWPGRRKVAAGVARWWFMILKEKDLQGERRLRQFENV